MQQASEISTDNLFYMLENSRDLDDEWKKVLEQMNAPSFHEYLSELISERGIDAAKLAVMAVLSCSFTYQICAGTRMPGRDIILRISIVLSLSLDETQRLLKLANRGILYPKIKRDSVLIYALLNKYDLYSTNELLEKFGQEVLL